VSWSGRAGSVPPACRPETRLPAYAVAVTVALARVLRAAQHPSDVLAEAIVDRMFPPD